MREKIYEYTVQTTSMNDFGVRLEDILAGKVTPPREGARIDAAFEGEVSGRLQGKLRGVDYLNMRADGRLELNVRGVFTTHDGCRIALFATGVGTPQSGSSILQIRENVQLSTSYPDYAWVNSLQIWAPGTVDLATLIVRLEGFAA